MLLSDGFIDIEDNKSLESQILQLTFSNIIPSKQATQQIRFYFTGSFDMLILIWHIFPIDSQSFQKYCMYTHKPTQFQSFYFSREPASTMILERQWIWLEKRYSLTVVLHFVNVNEGEHKALPEKRICVLPAICWIRKSET